jgi:thiol-disulfide isomerase/thioredoxin
VAILPWIALGSLPRAAHAQVDQSVQAIFDDYDRKLLALDCERLARLGRLAGRQNPNDAAATYEQLFRLAIAGNLFRDAEAAANTVVKDGSPSPATLTMAHLVRIVAQADRGAFGDSVASLKEAIAQKAANRQADTPKANLGTEEFVGICEAYYERLVHEGQYATARKAFQLVFNETQQPAVKDFVSNRLQRIDLVGKPAPPIRATDLDGKPFDLAQVRGNVVLVVFWASWCLPSAAEVAVLDQAYDTYRDRGFRIVGINLDSLQDDGPKLETVLPNVRRFLIDYNVRWPNLVNGNGDRDFAKAYGVTEIPANVLVNRDGTVVQIDLVRKNLEPMLSRVIGP